MAQKILPLVLVLVLAGGLVLLGFQMWIVGGILTVVGAVLLFFWWRLYEILRVSEALGKQNLEAAKQHLSKIKNPEKRNEWSRTYYHFFKGMIATQENSFKEAEAAIRKALEINKFRAPDERATAHFMLAQFLLRKRNREGARRQLVEAKSFASEQQLKEQIKTVAKQQRMRLS